MISTITEKYNLEHDELELKKLIAGQSMHVDLDRWFRAKLGNEVVTTDEIIEDDLLSHRNAPIVFKLMLTGHTDEALKTLIAMYDASAKDYINDAVEAHFWVGLDNDN